MKATLAYIVAGVVLALIGISLVTLSSDPPNNTPAEKLALRVDAVLDSMEPPEFASEDIDPFWTYEIAPFFEYEGLLGPGDDLFDPSLLDYTPPEVVWDPQVDGVSHNHLLGYTYCENQVFLNIRVINHVSAWYGWERNPIATLTHEMIHTLGGDFCAPFDSETAESTTQSATLEVLAALANQGNRAALYSLLLELKDAAEDVVLAQALADDDLDGFREFRRQLDPSATEEARFEKSMRFWSKDMDTLKGILDRYSVLVFENVQAGQVVMYLPDGNFKLDVLKLDDLGYVLAHMEELADDAGEEA
jgi:hypothetical protein